MFDCFDADMRASISSHLLSSCVRSHSDPRQAEEELSSMLNRMMCNSDASIVVQKMVEKGFYPQLKELRSPDLCYSEVALQTYVR